MQGEQPSFYTDTYISIDVIVVPLHQVFAAQKTGKNKVVISDFKANNPFYQSVAALR